MSANTPRTGAVVALHDNPCANRDDQEHVRQQLLAAGPQQTRLVIDCSRITRFGAGFLAVLVGIHQRLGARPGDVVLAGLSPLAESILRITRVDRLFVVCATVEEALAADWPQPAPLLIDAPAQAFLPQAG